MAKMTLDGLSGHKSTSKMFIFEEEDLSPPLKIRSEDISQHKLSKKQIGYV